MLYMNDFNLDRAARRYDPEVVPYRAALVLVVAALRDWTNDNSDGWAYWPKPCRAAKRAMEFIQSTAYPEYERRQSEDISEKEFKAALAPIKAFLTRQGVAHSVVGL
jgi:hypothetical protein